MTKCDGRTAVDCWPINSSFFGHISAAAAAAAVAALVLECAKTPVVEDEAT